MNRYVLGTILLASALSAGCGGSATCDASNCIGCCDASGACQGSADNTCGVNGAACAVCSGAQHCNPVGQCVFSATGGHTATTAAGSTSGSAGSTAASGSSGGSVSGSGATTTSTGSSNGSTSTTSTGASTSGSGATTAASGSTGATSTTASSSSSASSTTGTASTSTTSTSTTASSTTGTTATSTTGTSSTSTSTTTGTTTSTSTTGTTGAAANDACANALALTPTRIGDSETVTGDTTQATSDFTSNGCGGYGGDLFYVLHLSQEASITAAMTPVAGMNAVAAILASCGSTQELVCGDSTATGTATAYLKDAPAGDYIVVADNFANNDGPFSLTVTLGSPVFPPAGDNCTTPLALSGSGSSLSASGDNTSFGADYTSSNCGGSGNDIFYALHVPQASSLDVAVTSTNGALQPTIDLVSGCTAGQPNSELACGGGYTQPARLHENNLAAGDYFLVVDGFAGSAGPFNLTVNLGSPTSPPAGDSCETSPIPLTLSSLADGGHFASVAFDTTHANDNGRTSSAACFSDGPGPDLVYAVTAPTAGTLDVTVTTAPDGGFVDNDVVLYVRTSPCADTSGSTMDLACNDDAFGGPTATAAVTTGTYYVWVDSDALGAYGPGTLTVALH